MTGRRPARRARWIAIGAGTVALALVVAFALQAGTGGLARRVAAEVMPRASRALGREVTVRGGHLALLPHPRIRFDGLRVAGRPGEPPLLEAETLDVEVGLWRLLRSLAREADVRAVVLHRPTLNAVRAIDGSWSFERLGARGTRSASSSAGAESGLESMVAARALRIEEGTIRMVIRSASADEVTAALTRLDLRASAPSGGLPLAVRFAAALASDSQNLHADLAISAPLAVAPGRPALQGSLRLDGLELARIGSLLPAALGHLVRGGLVSLEADVTTAGAGWRLDGHGVLADLSLRGRPASGHFLASGVIPLVHPLACRFEVTELAVRGPGVELGGQAQVELSPLRVGFALAGPLLDLDAVMGALPEQQSGARGELLPEAIRRELADAQASGVVAVGVLRAGRVQAQDVRARATLRRGVLALSDLRATVFGGRLSGAGTQIDLGARVPVWRLRGRLSGVDLAAATKVLSGTSPLAGAFGGALDVEGAGTDWAMVREKVSGVADIAMKEGVLTSGDVGSPLREALVRRLGGLGGSGATGRLPIATGQTPIRDLTGTFTVGGGFLTSRKPLRFRGGFGDVQLSGRIGLDGRLELAGAAAVPWTALTGQAPGAGRPATLIVPLRVGGTLSSPDVSASVGAALAGAAGARVTGAAGAAKDAVERAGRGALDELKRLGRRP